MVVRVAVPRPRGPDDEDIIKHLTMRLPTGVAFAIQPVTNVGRAVGLGLEVPVADHTVLSDRTFPPCVSTGPLVRHNGETRPCCSSLLEADVAHPFCTPRADEVGLVATYRAWKADPILQLVRAIGFGPAMDWVRDALGPDALPEQLPSHPCDQCMSIWRVPGAAEAVCRRLEVPGIQEKIIGVSQAIFG